MTSAKTVKVVRLDAQGNVMVETAPYTKGRAQRIKCRALRQDPTLRLEIRAA